MHSPANDLGEPCYSPQELFEDLRRDLSIYNRHFYQRKGGWWYSSKTLTRREPLLPDTKEFS